MDLIYRREDSLYGTIDSGYLTHFKADFDITTDLNNYTNDFEIEMILPDSADDLLWMENRISCIVFVDGTEFGGEIKGSIINIAENTITYTGRTWRGTLEQYIIEPPAGQDYLVVDGRITDILRTLPMNPYITVVDTPGVKLVFLYKFERYVHANKGIDGMLTDGNNDFRSSFVFSEANMNVAMTIDPPRDLRELIEVSQDYNSKIQLQIVRDGNTPRHLICLGQGELHEREVIHLYADDDWNITRTPIAGAYPVDTYDISNSENLLSDGTKKYTEIICDHKQVKVTIDDLNIKLGDIIGARDHLTGEYVSAEISKIVWRAENYGTHQIEDFEYETKVRL